MGIFKIAKEIIQDSFKPLKDKHEQKTLEQHLEDDQDDEYGIKKQREKRKNADQEIADMQAADAAYAIDNDISKRIQVYERCVHSGVTWNKFNFALSLVDMYMKSNQNNKAWSLLNQTMIDGSITPYPDIELPRVRYWQYKILKQENKYLDALRMLVLSRLGTVPNFGTKQFQRECKALLKNTDITEEEFASFLQTLEAKGSKLTEDFVFKKFDSTFREHK